MINTWICVDLKLASVNQWVNSLPAWRPTCQNSDNDESHVSFFQCVSLLTVLKHWTLTDSQMIIENRKWQQNSNCNSMHTKIKYAWTYHMTTTNKYKIVVGRKLN